MSYITRQDIKDRIIDNFDIQAYLDEADSEIDDLAQKLGAGEVEDDPLHYKVKRYAVVFCLMRFCQDKAGSNQVTATEFEKYVVKFNMYHKELQALRSQISYEMITGAVDEMRDRATVTGTLFRG